VPKSNTGRHLVARLRDLREQEGLTQEDFAELAGISYKYYQLIEIGRRIDLRLSTLERLAAAYGLKVHQLLAPVVPRVKLNRAGRFKRQRRQP
jgi:transcriptional regulator with XRE-family HTH domain